MGNASFHNAQHHNHHHNNSLEKAEFEWKYKLEGGPHSVSKFCRISIENPDNDGKTALMAACESANTQTVKALLDLGANVNAETRSGHGTPLLFAMMFGRTEIVNLLLEYGAIPDAATMISHLESVQPGDKIIMKFLQAGPIIPAALCPVYTAIVISRYCFLHKIGLFRNFRAALAQMEALLTACETLHFDADEVLSIELKHLLKHSEYSWSYVSTYYGDTSHWWLDACDKDEYIAVMKRAVMAVLFPPKLQSRCRIAVLRSMPLGYKKRVEAIEKFNMLPPPLKDYLKCKC